MSDNERKRRKQLADQLKYTEETPNPDQYCSNCSLWVPPEEADTGSNPEGCGGCTLIPGPIHPDGYCTSWAQQPTT